MCEQMTQRVVLYDVSTFEFVRCNDMTLVLSLLVCNIHIIEFVRHNDMTLALSLLACL